MLFPLVFVLRDIAHRAFGAAHTLRVTVAALGANVVAVLAFALVSAVPAHEVDSYAAVIAALVPSARIVAASAIAFLAANAVDALMYEAVRGKWFSRATVSTSISAPLDSLVFALIAFAGELPASAIAEIVALNTAVKVAMSAAIAAPSLLRRGW